MLSTPIHNAVQATLRLLFPPRCVACADFVEPEVPLCAGCLASLTELGPACPRCAEPASASAASQLTCSRCRRHPLKLEALHSPWSYGGSLADALRRLKFQRQAWVARSLAPLVAPYLAAVVALADIEIVTFVPLHWRRRARRGFDQSSLLLAAAIPTVAMLPLLRRRQATVPQSRLPAPKRADNVRAAFEVRPGQLAQLQGRRVLVLDDVATTGATLDAAARALLTAGASAVVGFAVARAEAP